jgi:hypothetical protein
VARRLLVGGAVALDVSPDAGGKVAIRVWDRFSSTGEKVKEGRRVLFDETNLRQMADNWRARGDRLSMCFNHQSAYVEKNGQPAEALAYYDALAVVIGGKIVHFVALGNSSAAEVVFRSSARGDGLYGFRSEVTELGQKVLPNFRYISPMFDDDGRDERGREIGYVLLDVAATNTPFQAGCEITFGALPPPWMRVIEDEVRATLFSAMGGRPRVVEPVAQRHVYQNNLATFIVDDEEIAAKIREYADAKDGPLKMEIDAMLSEAERDLPDARWIAADKLVRTKKHPELWEQTRALRFGKAW